MSTYDPYRYDPLDLKRTRRSMRKWYLPLFLSIIVVAYFEGFPGESIGVGLLVFTGMRLGMASSEHIKAQLEHERHVKRAQYIQAAGLGKFQSGLMTRPTAPLKVVDLNGLLDEAEKSGLVEEVRNSLRKHKDQEETP